MAEVVVVLLLALLGLLGGHTSHRAGCPPASGLHDSVCGDVDGRPGQERVGVQIRRGPSTWLVVRFADYSAGVRLESVESTNYSMTAQTFVNGLAAIDRRPGLEIVVTVHEGASTAFGQVFKVENGVLSRIVIPGYGGEFAYEGSVTHFEVIDCARRRSALIWISGYWLSGTSRYNQQRTLYRLIGDKLVRVRRQNSRLAIEKAGRFPEFAEPQPFPHCLVVRSERTH
jgi:hypothetical protein